MVLVPLSAYRSLSKDLCTNLSGGCICKSSERSWVWIWFKCEFSTLVALRNSELYGHQHQPLLRKMLLHRGWLFRVCGVIVDPMHASSFQSSGLFHEVPFELVEVVRERSLGTRLDCGGPGCTWGTLQCSSNMSFGCAAACPSWAASVDGLGFRFPSVDLSCPLQG